jgi:alkanesulfonate monooxygenase SsuD/methylene tetrahydromethanopterin reductase-like flavin-dependent oxidoreductase (luciferase family)
MLGGVRHPRHIAEEATVVDLISSGRIEIGLGIGYRPEEYAAFDADFTTRASDVRRRLAELHDLLAGELYPPSVQRPIPLWGGFRGPRGARYAGKLGIGLLDANAATWAAYRDGLRDAAHPPERARLAHPANFLLAADPEAAWARIAPHYAYMWPSYPGDQDYLDPGAWVGRGQRGVDIVSPSRTLQFAVMTPAEADAHLRAQFDGMPIEHVFCWSSIAGMDDDLVEEHIALLTGELTARPADWRPAET